MRIGSNEGKSLIGNFFANIGVAWFTAGVIGAFLNKNELFVNRLKSALWGITLSLVFLLS